MIDATADRAAILAVIEAETDAYLRRDYAAWEKHWLDAPEIRRIHSHAGTGVSVIEGPEVRARMRRMLGNRSGWTEPQTVRRENLNIVISAEMAWVTYEQVGDVTETLGELAGRYHELKILHKVDGAWKIACIVGHQIRIDHVQAPLIEVDETGRVLWMNDAAKRRLPDQPGLCLRGAQLRASDIAAQTELIAAIAWISEINDRHTPCVTSDVVSRAVALGQDDAGLAHICWAILKDGKLLITFDDSDRLDQMLASAVHVYALSEMQGRLARHVIAGDDLPRAAQALGISLNTAKTHLQRIYDKTGVRTQPALVGLLLSADRRSV